MFSEKRSEFMNDIRRKNRMKSINRRRNTVQPGAKETSCTQEEIEKYSHLKFNDVKDSLIKLIEQVESSEESFKVSLQDIKRLILTNNT